jgi:hypothetical protein
MFTCFKENMAFSSLEPTGLCKSAEQRGRDLLGHRHITISYVRQIETQDFTESLPLWR